MYEAAHNKINLAIELLEVAVSWLTQLCLGFGDYWGSR
jgi:hypothetical protein